jgi:hypothetical protein
MWCGWLKFYPLIIIPFSTVKDCRNPYLYFPSGAGFPLKNAF